VIEGARRASNELRWAEAAAAYVRTEVTCGDDTFGLPPGLPLLQDCARTISDPRGRSCVLELLAEVHNNNGRRDEALDAARLALSLAESLQDRRLCARARFALGLTLSTGLDVAAATEVYGRGLDDLAESDDLRVRTKIVTRLPFLHFASGDLTRADESAAVAQESAWARRAYADHGLASSVRAAVALLRGNFLAAELHGRRAASDLYRSNYTVGALFTFPTLLLAHLLQDDSASARSVSEEWQGFAPAGNRRFQEFVACASGSALDVSPHRAARAPLLQIPAAIVLVEAETTILQCNSERQRAILPLVLEVANSELTTVPAWPVLPWRVAADLQRSLGETDQAVQTYEEAIRVASEVGALTELARASHGLALVDPDRRPELLEQALDGYRRLGMSQLERSALHDGRELGLNGVARPDGLRFILVTDLSGSTPYAATKGDEAYYRAIRAHDVVVREALNKHAGHEFSEAGDGLYAWFDESDDALDAAVMIRNVYSEKWPDLPAITVAIAGGDPFFAQGRPFGATVNLAARMSGCARAGQVILDQVTKTNLRRPRCVVSMGRRAIKGLSEPQELLLLA
jgi:class 3 adenylate cyclase